MTAQTARIAVLGASGLIGEAIARRLRRDGLSVASVARRFTPAQLSAFGATAITAPIASLDSAALGVLLSEARADVVVNCLGALQDNPRGDVVDVHAAFVARLLAAIEAAPLPILLVHVSIPGEPADDATPFSRTKRQAEAAISAASGASVILRPGFVIAPAAYGGNAMLRALASLPLDLPPQVGARPFAATAIGDIEATVAWIVERWREGLFSGKVSWDVLETPSHSVAETLAAFRAHFGGPRASLVLPEPLMDLGAVAGDLVSRLGWAPPIRSTALQEIRRGVAGDPGPWRDQTDLTPRSLFEALDLVPSNIQERWFGRLYLLKALAFGGLALFWIASGLIAATSGFPAARDLLAQHGWPQTAAAAFVLLTSLLDVAIGAAIAWRPTASRALIAAFITSCAYLAGASVTTPELWLDPLGPLVKVGPALILTLVAYALSPER